jgi:hypothetical protein
MSKRNDMQTALVNVFVHPRVSTIMQLASRDKSTPLQSRTVRPV